MKKTILLSLLIIGFVTSCNTVREIPPSATSQVVTGYGVETQTEDITQSLFSDKDATISEENIQRILNGKYTLPQKIRVAIVNLENVQYRRSYWNNEDYLSSREKYLNIITDNLKKHPRIESVSLIPQIMLPDYPTFSSIREGAVRMQADVVLIYSISGGIYSKYKLFKANEYKSFATAQMLMMDVRTGLVPFTRVISKDSQANKEKSDFNEDEALRRVQESSVLLTLEEICGDINVFLK